MAPAGWNTGEQIRTHQLATSIIHGHGTETDAVLDETELNLLQRFCNDPSEGTRDQIIAEQQKQQSGAEQRSLVTYLVGRHGTDNPALDARDIEMLKTWLESGRPVGERVVR